MPTLSELIASRRAAIEQFKSDMYGHDDHDISVLNEAIEKAPIVSKEDALAIVDFIREEAAEPEQHLINSAVAALRKFVEGICASPQRMRTGGATSLPHKRGAKV